MGMPAMLVVDMIVLMTMVVIVRFRMHMSGPMLVQDSCVRRGMVVMMMMMVPRTAVIVRVMVVAGMKRRRVRQDRRHMRRGSAVK